MKTKINWTVGVITKLVTINGPVKNPFTGNDELEVTGLFEDGRIKTFGIVDKALNQRLIAVMYETNQSKIDAELTSIWATYSDPYKVAWKRGAARPRITHKTATAQYGQRNILYWNQYLQYNNLQNTNTTVQNVSSTNVQSQSSSTMQYNSIKTIDANGNIIEECSQQVNEPEEVKALTDTDYQKMLIEAINMLNNFCSDLPAWRGDEKPSIRLVDTLHRKIVNSKNSVKEAATYLTNYCLACGFSEKEQFISKLQSVAKPEFENIVKKFANIPLDENTVQNNRLIIYFGAPGAGKTYQAEQLCRQLNGGELYKVSCDNGMIGSDLFIQPVMKNGVCTFKLTDLAKAAIKGKCCVLDEAALASAAVQATLQPLLDNSKTFSDPRISENPIEIKEGFMIIVTYNPIVNEEERFLVNPLVDRAKDIIKFVPKAKTIAEILHPIKDKGENKNETNN